MLLIIRVVWKMVVCFVVGKILCFFIFFLRGGFVRYVGIVFLSCFICMMMMVISFIVLCVVRVESCCFVVI